MIRRTIAAAAVISCILTTPAGAANVSLSGLVVNACILTVGTPGVLAPASSGLRLGSEETGGLPATLTVVATGTAPTLSFAAPTLSAPAGSSGSTTEIRYNASGSGASQAYTSSASAAAAHLLDTFTVNARVSNSSGFSSGLYTASTVVTCSQ